MNKNSIIIALSTLFLIGALIFSYIQKQKFFKELEDIKVQKQEIVQTIALQKLWRAKRVKSKIESAVASLKNNQKYLKIDKNKAVVNLANLNEKELNRVLSKLASMPIQLKNLDIKKVGNNFTLECKCVW